MLGQLLILDAFPLCISVGLDQLAIGFCSLAVVGVSNVVVVKRIQASTPVLLLSGGRALIEGHVVQRSKIEVEININLVGIGRGRALAIGATWVRAVGSVMAGVACSRGVIVLEVVGEGPWGHPGRLGATVGALEMGEWIHADAAIGHW